MCRRPSRLTGIVCRLQYLQGLRFQSRLHAPRPRGTERDAMHKAPPSRTHRSGPSTTGPCPFEVHTFSADLLKAQTLLSVAALGHGVTRIESFLGRNPGRAELCYILRHGQPRDP